MNIVKRIRRLYETQGKKKIGENITHMQHAVQTAALAERNGAPETLIASCLLHDIGHLTYNREILRWNVNNRHEMIGASILHNIFGDQVSAPVKLHVIAKRFLCTTDRSYYDSLSLASRDSFELQGGYITDSHALAAFERNPYFEQAISLRYWDDEGKDVSNIDIDFSRFIPMLETLSAHNDLLKIA